MPSCGSRRRSFLIACAWRCSWTWGRCGSGTTRSAPSAGCGSVALFVDVGQVWERDDTLSAISGVRVTPGLGLRFVTPLGPVRLDAAYNGHAAEPGPLFLQNNADRSLSLAPDVTIRPGLPRGFWRRVVVQVAVGQAF